MRKLFFIIPAAVAVLSLSLSVFADEGKPSDKVIAYYFHGKFRCHTCANMEKYSKEAIDANFKDALTSGSLEFKEVDVEDKGNEHFVDDYQLYTKTLILSLVRDGKEVKSKNLDKIWELARNKEKFIAYVAGEIRGFMMDAK